MSLFSRTTSRIRNSRSLRERSGGFTLLEITFVITIFAVMASIVLFRFKDFGAKTALDNLAQDIALRIVGAQKAATSGVLTPGLLGEDPLHAPSYGVYLTSGATVNTDDKRFVYFADLNHNGPFDGDADVCPPTPTGTNECLSVTTITTGDYISNLCYEHSSGGVGTTTTCDVGGSAYLTFTRPIPDARMGDCLISSPSCPFGHLDGVDVTYIELSSSNNPSLKETIIVTALGEVRVASGAACTYAGVSCGP